VALLASLLLAPTAYFLQKSPLWGFLFYKRLPLAFKSLNFASLLCGNCAGLNPELSGFLLYWPE